VAISITKSYIIGLSAAFREAHHVDQYRFVVPYFDDENQLIALRLTNDEREQGSFSLSRAGHVNARLFLRHFHLDANKVAGRYTPLRRPSKELGIDEPGDSFVIDLKAPTAPRFPQQP